MWDLNGTVDHFISRNSDRTQAYEWSNFRYVSGWLNSSKQTVDAKVLDPFDVRDEWFEIAMPSLVMRVTKCVPARKRLIAQFTLTRLHLADGDRIYDQRRIYHDGFQNGDITLKTLTLWAPLVARAIRRERVLAHLSNATNISIDETATICETERDDALSLLRLWVRIGHLRSEGRGRGVRYTLP